MRRDMNAEPTKDAEQANRHAMVREVNDPRGDDSENDS
jgi:hypothetical protein